MSRLLAAATFIALLTGPALADAALVIGNADYEAGGRLRGGDAALAAEEALRTSGFEVVAVRDASRAEARDAFARFAAAAEDAERIVVILSGRFAHSATERWLLPVDQRAVDLPAMADALPLSSVLAVLARAPGRAVLLIGSAEAEEALAPYVLSGPGDGPLPQGVTLVSAPPAALGDIAGRGIATTGADLLAEVRGYRGVAVQGFLPRTLVLVPKPQDGAPPPAVAPTPSAAAADEAYWRATRVLDTVAAYRGYLERYPSGVHAAEARSRILAISRSPEQQAADAEAALNLGRDARRDIQRDLTLLGFGTRGIDGIFGPGTRSAIAAWQAENGGDPTGHVSREDITRLDAQAARRAAELEAEAEARRAEQQRLDLAYWQETGAKGDEAGLRAYLKRYPDGVQAEVAQDRLAAIEAARRDQAAAQDRAAWDAARSAGTARAFRDYLSAYPRGAFADEARDALERLDADRGQTDADRRAAADEAALGLNPASRRLIEQRLDALGLRPGEVDGVFDDRTRRAIRRYQNARDLPVTGYLSQDTVVRIFADSILR